MAEQEITKAICVTFFLQANLDFIELYVNEFNEIHLKNFKAFHDFNAFFARKIRNY